MLDSPDKPLEDVAAFMDHEFPIFADRTIWPTSRDKVFIAEAVDILSDAIWGTDDLDLRTLRNEIDAADSAPDRRGVLWTMVKLFTTLLTDGSLSTFARPVGGTGTVIVRVHAWDGDAAQKAVARGVLEVREADGAAREHWLFLDRVEFELLLMVYSPAGGDPMDLSDNLRRRHDRMVAIVLENLSAIAKSRIALLPTRTGAGSSRTAFEEDPTREELDAMFADARRMLNADHQEALIARVAVWLRARFLEDRDVTRRKKDLRELAQAAFNPYLSDNIFRQAWQVATADFPSRARAGRPTKDAA